MEFGFLNIESKIHPISLQFKAIEYIENQACLDYPHHHFLFSRRMPNPDTLQTFILPFGVIISFPMILVSM